MRLIYTSRNFSHNRLSLMPFLIEFYSNKKGECPNWWRFRSSGTWRHFSLRSMRLHDHSRLIQPGIRIFLDGNRLSITELSRPIQSSCSRGTTISSISTMRTKSWEFRWLKWSKISDYSWRRRLPIETIIVWDQFVSSLLLSIPFHVDWLRDRNVRWIITR